MRCFSLNDGIDEAIITNQNDFYIEENILGNMKYLLLYLLLYSVADWDSVENCCSELLNL